MRVEHHGLTTSAPTYSHVGYLSASSEGRLTPDDAGRLGGGALLVLGLAAAVLVRAFGDGMNQRQAILAWLVVLTPIAIGIWTVMH